MLVVDDEPHLANIIAYSLAKLSCETCTASSAGEALTLMLESPADIIITDINMPGMDGLELTEKVMRQYPDTLVIAITGGGDIDTAVAFMKLGGFDFLQKPLDLNEIRFAIESAADRWHLRRQLRKTHEELNRKNIVLRKEIEARMESDERNEKLFETHSAIMLVMDPEIGDIVNANEAACAFYGYAKAEIGTLNITDINTQAKDEIFQNMRRAKEQKKNFFCTRHRLANGEIRDVEVFSVPVKAKDQNLLYSTIRDVSPRIQMEQALKASEEKYRNIFENASVGIYQSTLEGMFINVNPVMARIFGYASPDEMITCVTDISKIHAKPEELAELLRKALAIDGWFTLRSPFFRKDKNIVFARITLRLVRDGNGTPLYLEGFAEDITGEEQQREAFNLELSRAKELHNLILKPHLPMMRGVGIHVRCIPAESIGGDVIEILKTDESRLLFILADVTGHGISAAMTAGTLKTLFKEISETNISPASICGHVNKTMCEIVLPDDIIAAFCGLIDLSSMMLTYCLCGLPSPFIFRNEEVTYLKPTGFPLGVFKDAVYVDRKFMLLKNDILVAFTDGITEARAESGELFGLSGVERGIGTRKHDMHSIIGDILKEGVFFNKSKKFRDDIIFMGINLFEEKTLSDIRPWNCFCAPDRLAVKIKARYINVDEVSHFLMTQISEKTGMASEKLKTAFSDLLLNAVEHGNLEKTDLRKNSDIIYSDGYRQVSEEGKSWDEYGERVISIECLCFSDKLEISVKGEDTGLDIKAVFDPVTEPAGNGH